MKSRFLFALSALLAICLFVPNVDAQVTIRKVNLKRTFINGGGFRFVITYFTGSVMTDGTQPSYAEVEITVENVTDAPLKYFPQKVSFLCKGFTSKDSTMATVKSAATRNGEMRVDTGEKTIPPKAKLVEVYSLSRTLRLPACFCYDGKQLAWITN